MGESETELAKYVPKLLNERLVNQHTSQLAPEQFELPGVVMLVDITGFTTLSEKLSRQGPDGIENLSIALDRYFSKVMGIIQQFGGDVLKLAGDGLIVLWQQKEAQSVYIDAANCAFTIQTQCHNFASIPNEALSVRIGIAEGNFHAFILENQNSNWEFVTRSDAFAHVAHAQKLARPGEIVTHESLWLKLQDCFTGESFYDHYWVLRSSQSTDSAPQIETVTASPSPHVENFILPVIRNRIAAEQTGWQAELRRISILFVHVSEESNDDSFLELENLQDWMGLFAEITQRYAGTIKEWLYEETSISPVIVLGLPGMTHEDDPTRALHIANEIHESLKSYGIPNSIGVATGKAYFGAIGNEQRQQYALIGEVLNLASRLSKKQENAGVFCDENTQLASKDRYTFSEQGEIEIRGFAAPIKVFSPQHAASQKAVDTRNFVGHNKELQKLLDALQLLSFDDYSQFWIEGDPGLGKSTLIREWMTHAKSRNVRLLNGAGDSVQNATPYFAWRSILSALFELDELPSRGEKIAQVEKTLKAKFRWRQLVPLISDVLRLGVEDNFVTEQMLGKVRSFNLTKLIKELVQHYAQTEKLALVFEDVHWLDSASLQLLQDIANDACPALIVLTSRSSKESAEQRAQFEKLEYIEIKPMDKASCEELLKAKLDATEIEPIITEFIFNKTQGIPLYSIELAVSLQNDHYIKVADNTCRLVQGVDLSKLTLPENLQGVITERLDRLDDNIQLTAKVASIIGEKFLLDLLKSIYPSNCEDNILSNHIAELMDSNLVSKIESGEDSEYQFSHAIVQETIYDLILSSQKKTLHATIAQQLESSKSDQAKAITSLLGHHWFQAGEHGKAANYLGIAAGQSLKEGAYRAALDFAQQATKLLQPKTADGNLPPLSQEQSWKFGSWMRYKAEALLGLGEILQSLEAFDIAIKRMEGAEIGSLTPESIVQAAEEKLTKHKQTANEIAEQSILPVNKARCSELTLCYEKLGILYLFSNQPTLALNAAHFACSYSEPLEKAPERARALGILSLTLALIPNRELAQEYADWAIQEASEADQASTLGRVSEFISMWYMGEGRWDDAESLLSNAMDAFQELGDKRFLIECTCLMSTLNHFLGKFGRRVELGQDVCRLGSECGDVQAQSWGVLDQIESLLVLAEYQETESIGIPLLKQIGLSIFGADVIMAYGLLASLRLRQGNLEQAIEIAELGYKEFIDVKPSIVYNMEAYAGIATVFIAGWKDALSSDADSTDLREKALRSCEKVEEFASIFAIAQPRAHLLRGMCHLLDGAVAEAKQCTQQSFKRALKFGMDYEKGLAVKQLSELSESSSSEKDSLKQQARDIFSSVSAHAELV